MSVSETRISAITPTVPEIYKQMVDSNWQYITLFIFKIVFSNFSDAQSAQRHGASAGGKGSGGSGIGRAVQQCRIHRVHVQPA